jgi:hypothetical protein
MPIKHCANCEKPFTRPNSWDLCERCWMFNFDPKEFWEHVEQFAAEAKSLKKELGMPDDAQTNTIPIPFSGARRGDEWKGYYYESFGIFYDFIPEKEPPTGVLIYEVDDVDNPTQGNIIQVWWQKVTHDATAVYGEVRWHPERGERIAIKGVEQAKSKQEIELIWKGLKMLPKVREEMRRGRPVGSVIFDRDSFLQHSIEVYRNLLHKDAEHPSQDDVALGLGIVRASLARYLNRYGITWEQIREEALKGLQ